MFTIYYDIQVRGPTGHFPVPWPSTSGDQYTPDSMRSGQYSLLSSHQLHSRALGTALAGSWASSRSFPVGSAGLTGEWWNGGPESRRGTPRDGLKGMPSGRARFEGSRSCRRQE